MENKLDNSSSDYLAAVLKAAFSPVPLVGGFISELIGHIIPNQRIDRIADFCKKLDSKFAQVDSDKLNSLLQNSELLDLVEEGFIQANRAVTEERREYIASLIKNGIENDYSEIVRTKFALSLLSEINDEQIIILKFHHIHYLPESLAFKEKHADLLIEKYAGSEASENYRMGVVMQSEYNRHLERLGLLKFNYRKDAHVQAIIGRRIEAIKSIEITFMGSYLLKLIGQAESIYVPFPDVNKTKFPLP